MPDQITITGRQAFALAHLIQRRSYPDDELLLTTQGDGKLVAGFMGSATWTINHEGTTEEVG